MSDSPWNTGEVLINKTGSSLLVLGSQFVILRTGHVCWEVEPGLILSLGYSTQMTPEEWL